MRTKIAILVFFLVLTLNQSLWADSNNSQEPLSLAAQTYYTHQLLGILALALAIYLLLSLWLKRKKT